MRFDEFTEEEVKQLEELQFEINGDEATNYDLNLTLVKIYGDWYSVMEEAEGDIMERDGNYYAIAPTWWMHFNYNDFVSDYACALKDDEAIDVFTDNFDINEYAL